MSLDNGTFAKARRKDLVVLDAPAEMPVDLPDPEDRCPKCGNRNRSCTCGQPQFTEAEYRAMDAMDRAGEAFHAEHMAAEAGISNPVEDSGTLNTENLE